MLDISTMKIGFIGYGNMAGATGRGLMLSGAVKPEQIYACAKNFDKLRVKAETQGIHACKNAEEVCRACDIVFIGVKPYMVKDVMTPVKEALKGKMVVSLAANTYCDTLSEILPESHCVATAPNTPVSVCEGIFICEEENTLTDDEKVFVQELLENLGTFMWLDRDHMGIAGIIAGCSPAFVSMFMEALGDAACKHGLTRPVAYKIIAQMLAGTGSGIHSWASSPAREKQRITSSSFTRSIHSKSFRFLRITASRCAEKSGRRSG